MRKAYDHYWIVDGKNFVGVHLGADFTAEHERGIGDLYTIVGINNDDKIIGLARYKATTISECYLHIVRPAYSLLLITEGWQHKYLSGNNNPTSELYLNTATSDLATAWSNQDAGIVSTNHQYISELAEACKANNIAMWLGGQRGIGNAGLNIVIYDRVPQSDHHTMETAHLKELRLITMDADIGIREAIAKVNTEYRTAHPNSWPTPFGYYCLMPAFVTSETKLNTKYPLMYWLNPQDQKRYNTGWFSVEDLQDWLQQKGKVLRT